MKKEQKNAKHDDETTMMPTIQERPVLMPTWLLSRYQHALISQVKYVDRSIQYNDIGSNVSDTLVDSTDYTLLRSVLMLKICSRKRITFNAHWTMIQGSSTDSSYFRTFYKCGNIIN
ncbi:hypothetical protein CBL_09615 [Carabus blaptoides fortunei]